MKEFALQPNESSLSIVNHSIDFLNDEIRSQNSSALSYNIAIFAWLLVPFITYYFVHPIPDSSLNDLSYILVSAYLIVLYMLVNIYKYHSSRASFYTTFRLGILRITLAANSNWQEKCPDAINKLLNDALPSLLENNNPIMNESPLVKILSETIKEPFEKLIDIIKQK